jgi:hypothetical protein
MISTEAAEVTSVDDLKAPRQFYLIQFTAALLPQAVSSRYSLHE